jgi:hypothetical protein
MKILFNTNKLEQFYGVVTLQFCLGFFVSMFFELLKRSLKEVINLITILITVGVVIYFQTIIFV